MNISLGTIFKKTYVDWDRYFIAIEDERDGACKCIDMNTGEVEHITVAGYTIDKSVKEYVQIEILG